jgi:hypothetical protein
MRYKTIRHADAEFVDTLWELRFRVPLSKRDTVEVLAVLVDVLHSVVAQRLFEGLPAIQLTTEELKLCFRFSINREHRETLEKQFGHKEISDTRVNFMFFVLATIHQKFKFNSDDFPSMFEEHLMMTEYIV